MADLTATHWSLTATNVRIENKRRITDVTLTLASGNAAVYPNSGGVGIPLPTAHGRYGMVRNLDYIRFYEKGVSVATQGHYRYEFLASSRSVRIYTTSGPAELASTVAPANTDALVLRGEAVGW